MVNPVSCRVCFFVTFYIMLGKSNQDVCMRETTEKRTDRERGEGWRNTKLGEFIHERMNGRQVFRRKEGADLPPTYVQAPESSKQVIANERVVIIAGDDERAVGDKSLPVSLMGMTAEKAAEALHIDSAINKSRGAAIVTAEDGVAYRSHLEADRHVMLVNGNSSRPISHEAPTGVYEPQPGDVLTIVDTGTATRMCNEPGLDNWRSIEEGLLGQDTSYASVYFPEQVVSAMTTARTMRQKRNGTPPWAAAAVPVAATGLAASQIRSTPHARYTYDEDNMTVGPDNERSRSKRRGGKLGAMLAGGAAAAGTHMFFLKNRLKHTDRRENETDEAYERRRSRRTAAAVALGGAAVLGALLFAKWAHDNGGVVEALGLDGLRAPDIDFQEPEVDPLCPSPEANQNLGLPEDYCSYPEIPIPEDPRLDVDVPPTWNGDLPPFLEAPDIPEADLSVPAPPEVELPAPEPPETGVEIPPSVDRDYTQDVRTITPGEGWYDTFRQMGITDCEVQEKLINDSALMQQLEAGKLAYHDPSLYEEWGIRMTPDGTMPSWALDLIADTYQEIVQVDGNSAPQVPSGDVATAVESLQGSPAEVIVWGEGWLQTFDETLTELGMTDPNKQYAMHNNYALMSELNDMGLAYHRYDGWGLLMTENGKLPYEAKELIVRYANPEAYGLAS